MSEQRVGWTLSASAPPQPLPPRAAPRATSNVTGAASDAELQATLKSAGDRPVVVDFGASWCDHCRGMLPAVMGLTEKFAKHLFVLADVDSVPDTAADVRYTPTFSFYRRNRKVDEVYGVNQQQLHDHIWLHEDSN